MECEAIWREADKYQAPRALRARFGPQGFRYDPERLTCTCPAGKALYRNGANVRLNGTIGIKFTAPKSACATCPLRARCLRNAGQATPRRVVFFDRPVASEPQTLTAQVKAKIDSPRGRMIYSRRPGTVEPPFGNLLYHNGLDRFSLRGRDKVEGQWKLYAMAHNIEKLAHYAGDRWWGNWRGRKTP